MKAGVRTLAVLALIAAPVLAWAGVPSDRQVAKIQRLLGFDEAFRQAMQDKVEGAPEFADYSAKDRACVTGLVEPAFAGALNDAFRGLFEDRKVIEDWLAFADTPGGSRFMEFVRSGVVATVHNQPRPEPEAFMHGMTPEQFDDVARFMASPAAQVLQRDFPDLDLPPEQQAVLEQQVQSHCGVELPRS